MGRGYAFKLVNPAASRPGNRAARMNESDLNLELPDLKLTPRKIIVELAE